MHSTFGNLAEWLQAGVLTNDVVESVIELYILNVLRKRIIKYTEKDIVKNELDIFSDT